MNLASLGVVFAGGAGVPRLHAALQAGVPPQPRLLERESIPVLAVPPEALAGHPVLAPARRADRFSKMALLAGMEAWRGCTAAPERTGLILATALGPHATVFRYVSEMLDFGGEKASPTLFSQSVHAAAASMIAASAGLHGPVLTLSDLASPFPEALALAEAWLEGGRCDTVLVAAADELSDVLAHVVRRKWRPPAAAGQAAGADAGSARRETVPGEGAVCFRLERGDAWRVTTGAGGAAGAACRLLDTGALGDDGSGPADAGPPGVPAFCFTPYWGSLRIGTAFHLAAAALMLREPRLVPGAGRPAETTPGRGAPIEIVPAGGTGRVITLQRGAQGEKHGCP